MRQVLLALVLGLGVVTIFGIVPTQAVAQKGTKVRAQVSGTGTSSGTASAAADQAARSVSGGSYTTIRRETTENNGVFTCVMVIEYKR